MGTTSRGYPTPEGSDNVDIPGDLSALASAINTDVGSVDAAKAAKSTTITAGTGLTGGGDLSANRTLSIADGGVTATQLGDAAVTIAKRQEQYAAISTATTLGATQSVVDVTGTTTVTLPTAASHTGRVYIIRNSGTDTVTVSGITNLTLRGKGTVEVVSNGTAWSVLRGTYTDESVGRRIFTWDTVNSRWQMTYGDTGWREILAFNSSGTITQGAFHINNHWAPHSGQSGWIRVRRQGGRLHFWIANVASQLSNNFAVTAAVDLPVGFRWSNADEAVPINTLASGGGTNLKSGLVSSAYSQSVLGISQTGVQFDYVPNQQVSVLTDAEWPTSLPGTAVGTIPL